MATFEVKIVRVDAIEEHPNADAIEFARIAGYVSIVKKDQVKTGDLVVYVPEAAVMPQWLLEHIGLWKHDSDKGALAGKQGTRVKAIKLRGSISQGIVIQTRLEPKDHGDGNILTTEAGDVWVEEGQEVSELLGITKYVPKIPTCLDGEVCNVFGSTLKFDIENIQKHPDIFNEDEDVIATEKLHGCVSPDTLIMLPNGEEVPIDEIICNNEITTVLSYDVKTSKFVPKPITNKLRRKNVENKKWVRITLENGRILKITEDHPVFSNDRKTYINASDLLPGEDITSPV